MNTAMFAPSGIFVPIQEMLGRWASKRGRSRRSHQTKALSDALNAPKLVATPALPTAIATQKTIEAKPLRMVRVVDAQDHHGCVGHMVISGRMADVCAELDRLAAREIAQASGVC